MTNSCCCAARSLTLDVFPFTGLSMEGIRITVVDLTLTGHRHVANSENICQPPYLVSLLEMILVAFRLRTTQESDRTIPPPRLLSTCISCVSGREVVVFYP